MKKKEIYDFSKGLDESAFEHPSITYIVNVNKREVKERIEDMEKCVEPDEEMKKFTEERRVLAEKHAKKNEDGSSKTINIEGQLPYYDIEGQFDTNSSYSKEFVKLQKKYKATTDKHDAKVKAFNEVLMEEESDFKPKMLLLSVLVKHEKCPQSVMDKIFYMIDPS
jgi:hypothetical protein